MDEKIRLLEAEIRAITERNKRVESDKAWETSGFRVFSICVITYIIASFVFFFLGVQKPMFNAFVPTIGYFLSTLSLPYVKRWWVSNFFQKNKTTR